MSKTFQRASVRFQEGNPLKVWLALMILVLVVQATPAQAARRLEAGFRFNF